MTRCITWTTGRRPYTAQTSLEAIRIQLDPPRDEFIIVQWNTVGPPNRRDFFTLPSMGTNRAQGHNAGLAWWRDRHHGEWPDYWFALDDDVLPCQRMFERMQAVTDADERIGLLGAWNDGCQRTEDGGYHGQTQMVAGEVVQFGTDFNVGGAVSLIPKRTLDRLGPYDPEMTWLEDHDYTQRVRAAGMEAAIARTIFAGILVDDGYEPEYRAQMTAEFFKNRKEKLGW